MRFLGTHNVTAEDVARAMRLARRPAEVLLNVAVVIVLVGIMVQVLYAFFIYLTAATAAPRKLLELLLMQDGAMNAIVAWLSIFITLLLPVFLFYAVRALTETLWPVVRARRLLKGSDITGPTTYTIDEQGVRSARFGGTETFMPWTTFDQVRSDSEIVALTQNGQLRFFVPFAAFGAPRDQVTAEMQARVAQGRQRPHAPSSGTES
jgi:hypothetical protein